MVFRFFFALTMLAQLVAAPAAAQPWNRMFDGIWTYGDASNCGRQRYEIAEQAGTLVFRDQDGKVNIEIIVERRLDGIATQTSQSGQVQAGTQWDYQQAGPNLIQVRNKTLGRSFNLARCSSFGAPTPVADNGAAASLAFAQRYVTTWSSDNQTALAFVGAHYLPEVFYYGKPTPRNTIMQQKDSFVRRWPIRSYVIVPGSASTRCGSDGCEITMSVDWTCRSVERGAESAGVSVLTLRLVGQGGETMIALENGAVTARHSPGPPGNPPPAATWTPPPFVQPERPAAPPVPQIDIPPPRL